MIKDISNMKIQGILANKIYDKTYKNIVKESLKSEEFIISGNEKYIKGDKVSIDRILVDYNFIGVIDDEDSLSLPNSNDNKNFGVINIKVNNNNIRLSNNNKGYKSKYIQTSYILDDKKVNKTPNLVYLYKEFQGNINLKNISFGLYCYCFVADIITKIVICFLCFRVAYFCRNPLLCINYLFIH